MRIKAPAIGTLRDAQRATFTDYATLAKPGIVGLVTVAALAGCYIGGARFILDPIIAWTILGIALAAAGSCILNNYLDRDIDALMARTKARALARGSVHAVHALIAGITLAASSIVVLYAGVGPLAAELSACAIIIYVVLYSIVLKRRSSWANQVGGLAGALPPVIGYAAITGTLDSRALILFLIVGVWQQPHALSLALRYTDDYRRAAVPTVPVSKGARATKLRIFIYTLALAPLSTLPTIAGMAGIGYLATALVLGGVYIYLSAKFLASERDSDLPLFIYSIAYLTLIFGAMVLDLS